MTEYKAGQRVRIEWPDCGAVEGVLDEAGRIYPPNAASVYYVPQACTGTVTILAEPRPDGHADVPMSQSSGHDPLCFCDEFGVCICKELQRRDDRVRADERATLSGKLLTLYLQLGDMLNDYNHAEAVAARLVEVICEDAESEAWLEDSNQQLQGHITTLTQNGYALRRERDAARAEVAALRELNWATIAAEQKILLDRLRAKVEGLRDREEAELDGPWTVLREVIALIEGGGTVTATYLYEVAEDVYLARTGSASTNGIAAVVDVIEPLIRREVLADLRAKVDGLPVRLTDDGVGTSLYVYVKRADVLALIEEVQP